MNYFLRSCALDTRAKRGENCYHCAMPFARGAVFDGLLREFPPWSQKGENTPPPIDRERERLQVHSWGERRRAALERERESERETGRGAVFSVARFYKAPLCPPTTQVDCAARDERAALLGVPRRGERRLPGGRGRLRSPALHRVLRRVRARRARQRQRGTPSEFFLSLSLSCSDSLSLSLPRLVEKVSFLHRQAKMCTPTASAALSTTRAARAR